MIQVYYDEDANIDLLNDKTIGIIGYGSQGHAHALNLRDSGCTVRVGLYEGSRSWSKVEEDGLGVDTVDAVTQQADLIMMLTPDTVQPSLYEDSIAPHLRDGHMLLFAHGFNIHFQQIVPPANVDVSMVAPKAPGHRMRATFEEGNGVPGLLAIQQDASGNARELTLAYARGIGCTRAGVLNTTFKEETETDLFGEQTVLCGGVSALVKAAFEILVDAGYQPEIAYFECMHELKLIVDLFYQGGLNYMRYSVSETAEYGDYSRGPRVVDDHVRESMQKILHEIQTGEFAREWILENMAGRPAFNAHREMDKSHQIETVGKNLRAMMPWLDPK